LLVRFADAAGHAHHLESDWAPGTSVWRGLVDDDLTAVQVRPILNGFLLSHQGVSIEARVFTRREAELFALMPEKKAADTSKVLLCPMPGLVKQLLVVEGQEVKAGEALCMVEAMKMENVLRAEKDVTVKKVNAKEGDSLAVDAVIMEFA
jgi:propionyl-CoA carboxylase alpha chain